MLSLIWCSPFFLQPTIDKDSNYYKTLMAGMKNEFAAELEKVKAHVKREKTR